ncbi:Mut7-C RNAse domain-containing protein [candidate division NPL-UPA2 bacterium]|nr:Mut7-C RNAse domain-containing protein [candidate division NPL-UPA2 bacterium]
MLGRLARWLRMLGYDTLYPQVRDSELVRLARAEGRILLTRDTHLGRREDIEVLFIDSDRVQEQLKQIIKQLSLKIDNIMSSRCTICNSLLKEVGRQEAKDFVPEFTYVTHDKFGYCQSCHKFYWSGTHWQKMEEFLCNLN